MTLEEKTVKAELAYHKGLVAELSAELRRVSRRNAQLKAHIQIIAGIPYSGTAEKMRQKYAQDAFADTIINLN